MQRVLPISGRLNWASIRTVAPKVDAVLFKNGQCKSLYYKLPVFPNVHTQFFDKCNVQFINTMMISKQYDKFPNLKDVYTDEHPNFSLLLSLHRFKVLDDLPTSRYNPDFYSGAEIVKLIGWTHFPEFHRFCFGNNYVNSPISPYYKKFVLDFLDYKLGQSS